MKCETKAKKIIEKVEYSNGHIHPLRYALELTKQGNMIKIGYEELVASYAEKFVHPWLYKKDELKEEIIDDISIRLIGRCKNEVDPTINKEVRSKIEEYIDKIYELC